VDGQEAHTGKGMCLVDNEYGDASGRLRALHPSSVAGRSRIVNPDHHREGRPAGPPGGGRG